MPGYRTGGTIHVHHQQSDRIHPPQPKQRASRLSDDICQIDSGPHVPSEWRRPEACVWAARLAIAFREQFKMDVIIDLWCYRRHGHNDTDEPASTQPVMYREIEHHKTTRSSSRAGHR
jgi:2-oxoglutarate dehydrogenase complex dehydrogenase (E1) component-like enzyme